MEIHINTHTQAYLSLCVYMCKCVCWCQRLFKLWNNLFLLRNFYYWFPSGCYFCVLLLFYYTFHLRLRCQRRSQRRCLGLIHSYNLGYICTYVCVYTCVCAWPKLFMEQLGSKCVCVWHRKFWSSFTCRCTSVYVHTWACVYIFVFTFIWNVIIAHLHVSVVISTRTRSSRLIETNIIDTSRWKHTVKI